MGTQVVDPSLVLAHTLSLANCKIAWHGENEFWVTTPPPKGRTFRLVFDSLQVKIDSASERHPAVWNRTLPWSRMIWNREDVLDLLDPRSLPHLYYLLGLKQ